MSIVSPFLVLECDGNAVCVFELGMVVAELLGTCKNMDVAKACDFGSSLLGVFDFQIFAGSDCEEDSHGGKLGCCPFKFGAVLFGNFADD